MRFIESLFDELQKVADGGVATLNAHLKNTAVKPSRPKFNMRQDTMRKALAKRYEEKAPGRPWYKHPAAMIGGGALAGYAGSRLMNRDDE